VLKTFSKTSYVLLVLLITVATVLSAAALLSQAVRTSPNQSWTRNINALLIGASYVIVFVVSLLYYGKRRIAVRLKLQKITKASRGFGRKDVSETVNKYIAQEYVRTCLVAYQSLPDDAHHEGWGKPGTKYSGIRFGRTLLDTIPAIDNLAQIIIPTHPPARPHARMLHRFRFILPLLPGDEDGLTPLHYYDAAVQVARNGDRELTEQEYEIGIRAAREIEECLEVCQAEMQEGSTMSTS